MANRKQNKKNEKEITLDGLMTIGRVENMIHAEFMCCEDVRIDAAVTNCKVQLMRDGNVYITELPKRVKNKPMFRDDNCSLSLGRDGRYYFVFSLPEQLVDELPKQLVRQASAIAQKVMKNLIIEN
ncbi:MAG: hypothetical protein II626_02115 [Prevotella sp.]|nr:hypothetical protein [Prevotella sp.]